VHWTLIGSIPSFRECPREKMEQRERGVVHQVAARQPTRLLHQPVYPF
jgi:hypothetical protein